jgi:hypothetical protein
VFETPVVSAEGTAASTPCLAEIQTPKIVEAESPGFVEAVAELEHPGPPVETGTHPARAVAAVGGKTREAAAVLPPIANSAQGSTTGGAGVEHPRPKGIEVGTGGHPSQAEVVEGTGVEHPIQPVAVAVDP